MEIKNKTYYAVSNGKAVTLITEDEQDAIRSLDSKWNILVELRVEKMYQRNPELIEIT